MHYYLFSQRTVGGVQPRGWEIEEGVDSKARRGAVADRGSAPADQDQPATGESSEQPTVPGGQSHLHHRFSAEVSSCGQEAWCLTNNGEGCLFLKSGF